MCSQRRLELVLLCQTTHVAYLLLLKICQWVFVDCIWYKFSALSIEFQSYLYFRFWRPPSWFPDGLEACIHISLIMHGLKAICWKFHASFQKMHNPLPFPILSTALLGFLSYDDVQKLWKNESNFHSYLTVNKFSFVVQRYDTVKYFWTRLTAFNLVS